MPAWVTQGYEEYAKRLPKELTPKLIELPLANRSKNTNAEKLKEQEGEKIIASVASGAHMIALDVLGKSISTHDLAEQLGR